MSQHSQITGNAAGIFQEVHAFITQPRAGAADGESFNRLALRLFAFQHEEILLYKRVCQGRGINPESIRDWRQIPALPTSAFKEFAVSSLPEGERTRTFHSSGTTGHVPSRHFHDAMSMALYEASLLPWFERHFPGESARFLFLTPPAGQAGHSSLIHMFETVRQKLAAEDSLYAGRLEADGSWSLDFDGLAASAAKAMADNRPLTVLGTAFSFVHWLDHLAVNKSKLRLPAGSRVMETGGYKGRSRAVARPELRRLITKFLGVPEPNIVTEYGMCELSSQAYDGIAGDARPGGGVFQFPPWARTQIVSPETGAVVPVGETGLLRVFDLANIRSVMAIQTEDLAVRREDGFELLGRAAAIEARGCSLMVSA